ncbi:MAG: hypothetical protein OSB70_09555 [Myxococcota bacterium]|nr:hypothetical protein [Myxococcota bacterium]
MSPLVLLLVAALALGAWNYSRNARADRDNPRSLPFAGYATADLDALREAYAAEVESARRAESGGRGGLAGASAGPNEDGLRPRIQRFEASQARADALRAARADWAQSAARLAEVDTELARRQAAFPALRVEIRRLVDWR